MQILPIPFATRPKYPIVVYAPLHTHTHERVISVSFTDTNNSYSQ